MLRLILGIIIGVLAGFTTVFAVEMIGVALYPMPEGLDTKDAQAMAAYIAGMPPGAFAIVLAALGLAGFVGTTVALLVAERRALAGWIVTAVVLAATVFNIVTIPHPVWFAVVSVAIVPIGGWLATRLFGAKG